ncbi:MAG: hypothetical protein KGJ70_09620 [Gemmatimonadota bacterium]|nr:hypothetical protein [Gemmatimonadota bacterium]
MRKLIIGLALAAGCRTAAPMAGSGSQPPGNVTGATTEHAAIDQFMAAITAQDVQALGGIWGTKDGPAREQMSGDQLQERELIMFCYFKHNSYDIVSDAPSLNGDRTFAVLVKFGPISHTGQFQVTRAKDGRFYVVGVNNFPEFQDVCAAK